MTNARASVRDLGPGRLAVRTSTGGIEFTGDEPVPVGGGGQGPGPYDLLCAALAECTSMTVRLYADRKAWSLERIEVTVEHSAQAGRAPPDLFTREVRLTGSLDEDQRSRLLEIAERCPVHRTLTTGSAIETHLAPLDG